MKKLCALMFVCILLLALVGCGSGENPAAPADTPAPSPTASLEASNMPEAEPLQTQQAQEPPPAQEKGSRILIAYFSYTGTTRGVAQAIHEATGGNLLEIEVVTPYPEAYDDVLVQARSELQEDARPEIATAIENAGNYDVLFIGYPIWHGTCPRAVLTFLEAHDLRGKTLLPFATSGSSGISRSVGEIQGLFVDATVLDGLVLSGSAASEPSSAVDEWLAGLDLPEQADHADALDNTLYLQVGNRTFTATLVENSSTEALKQLLADGPLTIDMHDYGDFEKVGELGTALPTNDEQITTEPGDLILYQSSSFVIYYAENTWRFTRLGKIDGVSETELKEALGSGDVTVTLSLKLK